MGGFRVETELVDLQRGRRVAGRGERTIDRPSSLPLCCRCLGADQFAALQKKDASKNNPHPPPTAVLVVCVLLRCANDNYRGE